MNEELRVTVVKPGGRTFYQARWTDPVTGRIKTRSTGVKTRREADKKAGEIEAELRAGKKKSGPMLWTAFQTKYETEVLKSKRETTKVKMRSLFKAIERLTNPKWIHSLADEDVVSKFKTDLEEEADEEGVLMDRAAYTVKSYLINLVKILNWAKKKKLISEVPDVDYPTVEESMRGRPITGEEFDRMVVAAASVIDAKFLDGWAIEKPCEKLDLLNGLWLSGMRLNEVLRLHWEDQREILLVMTGKHPMLQIQAKADKSGLFRLCPLTPHFAEFVKRVPVRDRHGYVFKTYCHPPRGWETTGQHRPTMNHASRLIAEIGKAAGVKVAEDKFASAHDLRRSFGFRWAKIVMPKVLMELMRHRSITTTLKFYVGQFAEDAVDEVIRSMQRLGITTGNTSEKSPSDAQSTQSETHDAAST
jgi:integrase